MKLKSDIGKLPRIPIGEIITWISSGGISNGDYVRLIDVLALVDEYEAEVNAELDRYKEGISEDVANNIKNALFSNGEYHYMCKKINSLTIPDEPEPVATDAILTNKIGSVNADDLAHNPARRPERMYVGNAPSMPETIPQVVQWAGIEFTRIKERIGNLEKAIGMPLIQSILTAERAQEATKNSKMTFKEGDSDDTGRTG